MVNEPKSPPRIAETVLGFLCPRRGALSPVGDFAEAYAEIAARRGSAAAGFWYGSQILRSIPGFLLTRFYWSAIMFRNYLVIYFRNLIRDKGTSLINLAGLAAGMACFLLILTYVRFEMSYDGFHANAGRVYRLLNVTKSMGVGTTSPDPLAAALKAEIPEIRRFTQIMPPRGNPVLQAGEKQFFEKGFFADASFLEILSFPLLSGDRSTALAGPAKIVLCRSAAEKFFGTQNPIGKTMTFKDLSSPRDLTVTAIVGNIPSNSHIKFDFLISLDTLRADKQLAWMFGRWTVANFPTYLELAEGTPPAAVESKIAAWSSRLVGQGNKNLIPRNSRLQSLLDIHLRSDFRNDYAETGDMKNVRLFMAIAVLVLLIAGINHVNLATARSGVRAREIGIRKTAGAFRGQVFQQFLGESFALMILAGTLALGLYVLVFSRFAALVGVAMPMSLVGSGSVLPWLALTIILVALVSGIYPASILSALPPVRTLRELSPTGRKGSFLRNLLFVSQFTASVALVAATLVVLGQMRFVRSTRLGYDREHVVVISASERETRQQLPTLKAELERRPEVVRVSQTSGLPTDIRQRWQGWKATKEDGTEIDCDFKCDYVDENFLSVFKIELAAGRDFRAGDKDAVLLNETAVRDFGWTDLTGKKLKFGETDYKVLGIVRDFHFASLHNKIEPLALIMDNDCGKLAVRLRPGDLGKTMGVLRSVFEKNIHGQPFDFSFLDDDFNSLYKKEVKAGSLFGAFAGLAVLIAGLGLFGLTSFTVARRVKEIGIRKILGASVSRLVLLLNRDFIRLVVIANLLAWPLAYAAMNKWLELFAYRISVSPWTLLLASLLSLAIAFLIVAGQTVKAASANPTNLLRYE
jgi:putative ABC transport system permease protein